jgi:septal ring factor EnvC (AmiA/AmiB activator)
MAAKDDDITNWWLAKFISADFLILLISGSFMLGTVYYSLAQGIESTKADVVELQKTADQQQTEAKEVRDDINSIKLQNARIETNVQNMSKDLDRVVKILEQKK